jgi:hypothetical protein
MSFYYTKQHRVHFAQLQVVLRMFFTPLTDFSGKLQLLLLQNMEILISGLSQSTQQKMIYPGSLLLCQCQLSFSFRLSKG